MLYLQLHNLIVGAVIWITLDFTVVSEVLHAPSTSLLKQGMPGTGTAVYWYV